MEDYIRQFYPVTIGIHLCEEGQRYADTTLVAKREGKSKLGRPGRRLENNGETDLKNRMGLNWIDLAQERDEWQALLNTLVNIKIT